MRKTECELNASFGLIRVFASAALKPGTLWPRISGAGLSARRVARVFNTPGKVGCVYHKPAALKPETLFFYLRTVFQGSRVHCRRAAARKSILFRGRWSGYPYGHKGPS